jgi:Oxidoreductase molybdopterin binding domain
MDSARAERKLEEQNRKQAQISNPYDRATLQELRRRSRRGFLIGAVGTAAAFGFWEWLLHRPESAGLPHPLRTGLEFNTSLWRRLFRSGALAPEYPRSQAVSEFRLNGDLGLSEVEPEDWRLQVVSVVHPERYPQFTPDVNAWDYGWESDRTGLVLPLAPPPGQDAKSDADVSVQIRIHPLAQAKTPGLLLTMEQIHALPKYEMTTEFKCIEGWSEIVHWGGARLSDFIAAYPPATKSGQPIDIRERPHDLPAYVGLSTPDGGYYVGIELDTALHPQTLLAYELNGKPLTPAHGAPLRLVTPLKYGVKQLKQIGRVSYSDERPPDYWYQQGYDYYVGL